MKLKLRGGASPADRSAALQSLPCPSQASGRGRNAAARKAPFAPGSCLPPCPREQSPLPLLLAKAAPGRFGPCRPGPRTRNSREQGEVELQPGRPWGTGLGMRPAGEGPSAQAELNGLQLAEVRAGTGEPAKACDSTEETITQRKKKSFIDPSKGLMPGNKWSPCPPPLGDRQNTTVQGKAWPLQSG